MQKQIIDSDIASKELLTEPEACHYAGMSRTAFRAWALKIGAVRKRGRRTLYHKATIKSYLDNEAPATFGKGNGVPAGGGSDE